MWASDVKIYLDGVLPVVLWAKNPTAVAQVTVEAQVRALAQECPYAAGVSHLKRKRKKRFELVLKIENILIGHSWI